MIETPLTALVLSGGGARAAYQVGVLRAVVRLRREALGARSRVFQPFGVICGTSAGAINAAALACQADRFEAAVEVLARVWQSIGSDQVYRSDSLGVLRSGAQWLTMVSLGWLIARWRRLRPRSLLDNDPLADLLRRLVPLERLPMMLATRQLHAFAVTASSYTNGTHYTFYSTAQPVRPWVREQRIAVPSPISYDHLLASSAIPFVFPAARIEGTGSAGWFGDGSMRQTAPLSPAIHLGAQRLFIVGVGRMQEEVANHGDVDSVYPSLAQVAGHALASIFLDSLSLDVERMLRINRTLALLPESALGDTPLRPVEALVISPSRQIDEIAARHVGSLPAPVRALLRGVGVGAGGTVAVRARGAALASYLLFEAPFTGELIALGEADTIARSDEVRQFFGWDRVRRATLARPDIELP